MIVGVIADRGAWAVMLGGVLCMFTPTIYEPVNKVTVGGA